jgi:hypothetical protein
MANDPESQITMSRIPIRGGIGAFAMIVILVAGVLGELPQLRLPFLGGVALGLVFAVALILWRRRTMDSHTLPPGAHTMFVPEPESSRPAIISQRGADDNTHGPLFGLTPILHD